MDDFKNLKLIFRKILIFIEIRKIGGICLVGKIKNLNLDIIRWIY